MKLRSKETYWLLKNGIINSYPSLHKDITCDILIVGGGITGSLIAYQFAQEGYKTVLLDKRDISTGSTSATTALLQYEIDEPLNSLIKKVGLAAAIDTYREGVNAINKLGTLVRTLEIDCDFGTKKSLFVAQTVQHRKWLEKEFEVRASSGLNVSWLSESQLMISYQIRGKGAILSADAASVDGYKLAHGLLEYAVKYHHLEIYDHTAVEKVDYDNIKNYARTEYSNTVTCQYVIYATGYETQSMLKDKIVDLVSTYACICEPLDSIPDHINDTLVWNTDDPYLYLRSTPDKRILIGGEDENFKDAERRDRQIEKKEQRLMAKFKKLIPAMDIIPDFTWAGTFGITKDALPYIGAHPDYPNSYFVLGFGGNGITFSIMGMDILSDAIAGRENKFLHYFRFNR